MYFSFKILTVSFVNNNINMLSVNSVATIIMTWSRCVCSWSTQASSSHLQLGSDQQWRHFRCREMASRRTGTETTADTRPCCRLADPFNNQTTAATATRTATTTATTVEVTTRVKLMLIDTRRNWFAKFDRYLTQQQQLATTTCDRDRQNNTVRK